MEGAAATDAPGAADPSAPAPGVVAVPVVQAAATIRTNAASTVGQTTGRVGVARMLVLLSGTNRPFDGRPRS